jgi:enamine deaminase RidA (YjgF/YER057c/UK114 family)
MTDIFDPDRRLEELGLELPPSLAAAANFEAVLRDGGTLYLSGQGPRDAGGYRHGKVGQDVTFEEAHLHARLAGLTLLRALRDEIGSLGRVRQIIKLFGMVNATPDFFAHSQVIDGCSNLFTDVFGPRIGRHARSAVGVGSLPGNISVEIEAIVAIAP